MMAGAYHQTQLINPANWFLSMTYPALSQEKGEIVPVFENLLSLAYEAGPATV